MSMTAWKESKRPFLAALAALLFAALPVGCGDDDSVGDGDDTGGDAGDGTDDPAILIETADLPAGRVAMPYEAPLAVSDAEGEVHWSVVEGALPPGLALADGAIEGVPERSGSFAFALQAEDDDDLDSVDLVIEIPTVVLMSGFEPFGGYETNPSIDAILPLHEQLVSGLDVRTVQLEVSWSSSWPTLLEEIERLNADVVIGTGMAQNYAMRFETLGRNIALGTDNADAMKTNEPVIPDGPETVAGSLPIEEMSTAMQQGGFATMISDDAGNYLCNWVFYNLSYWAAEQAVRDVTVGFIHVPPAPYESDFTVQDITDAHELGLGALATWLAAGAPDEDVAASWHEAPQYF